MFFPRNYKFRIKKKSRAGGLAVYVKLKYLNYFYNIVCFGEYTNIFVKITINVSFKKIKISPNYLKFCTIKKRLHL